MTLSSGRHPDVTSGHTHAEAQRAYLIGKAIRDRRLALGLSQVELAT